MAFLLVSLWSCTVWLASADLQSEPTTLLQHSVHGRGESELEVASDSKRAKYQVIVDTDMDTDDQMAIAYLLAQPDIEVLAILVGCNGWSQQWQGVMSVMRLTKYFGKAHLPVAFSPRVNGDTQLNLEEPNSLPNPELLKGKADFLAEYVGLPFNVYPPSWMYTDRLLEYTLRRVTDKVDLIALGPLTNLAHFLQESPLLFERKVKRIYFSGGEVVSRSSTPTDQVWPYTDTDTSYTGEPDGVEWNIFSDPVAANAVFQFGMDLVLATTPYQDNCQFSSSDSSYIPSSCNSQRAQFASNLVTYLPIADGESDSDLRYWDQSAMVLFVQMILNGGVKEAAVCTEWSRKKFAVMLEAGDNSSVSGGQYARLLENADGSSALLCTMSNATEMKRGYFAGLCGSY